MNSGTQHIVIIGGGFSGTMAAVNLARLARKPVQVTLVNSGRPTGRGTAYGTTRPEHLLNVVARNMSAFPDHPNHFLEWLRTRTEYAGVPDAELRETFMPRRVYGDYLRGLALHHCTHRIDADARVRFTTIEAEATGLEAFGGGARVMLADGRTLDADHVLLATGNEPPADLPGHASVAEHPAWCADPWLDWESRLPASGDVVLLGTGLTTIDAILTLLALDRPGVIHAVSRNGLLPQSHFKGTDDPHFPPANLDPATLGLDGLVKLLEEHCARLSKSGANPAMLVDKLRPHTQRIWQSFTEAERHEFVEKHAARWNVIRHRIAPAIHRQVTGAIAAGRLKIVRAGIVGVKPLGNRVRLDLRNADGTATTLDADLAINGTGPHTRFSATRSSLLRDLLSRGLATPDAMDMGVRVEPDFTVIGRDGKRTPFLHAMGPLLRGTLWESIAVPELRSQALHVAQSILGTTPSPVVEEPVIEYHI